jgi:transcriptional regulator with XRE-family HTH domain
MLHIVTDIELGRALRAIRHRRGWTQAEVAARAGVPQSVVSRTERGLIEGMSLRSLRRICTALEVRLMFTPSWRGGELARLLDEGHAAVTDRTVVLDRRYGWSPIVEVTFSHYGERGSIDVLALRPDRLAALIQECKTELASTEELNRGVDRKVRLAADLVQERFGWRPKIVGRLVVFADTSSNRRRVAAANVLAAAYPTRGRDVTEWLREPVGSLRGLVFVSVSPGRTGSRSPLARKRVRKVGWCMNAAAPERANAPGAAQ